MRPIFFSKTGMLGGVLGAILMTGFATAEPSHGIAMYGEPALPPDFVSLPYVNPDAPQGGRIVFAETSNFDSLHPFVLKGASPYGWRVYGFESLMGRNWDEPFTLYGLLAESVETGPNREWVEFTLREEAQFNDGTPVTVEDVMWSFEMLGKEGHPRYVNSWKKVASMEATGPRSVKISFNAPDNEMPLIMGLRPVMKKASFEGREFGESSLVPPVGSGPYVIDAYEAGRFVTLKRTPDWWGKDLPFNRGQHNIDEIKYEFFGDGDVAFEAFRAGEISVVREGNAAKWETAYNFPAVQSGDIVKSVIPHQRPSGITGMVMNTRNPIFQDWRVREAMTQMFNFEFINTSLNGGTLPRITSYFSNSVLAMQEGPAQGKVRALLEPFADQLVPGVLEGYTLPVSNGSEQNRKGLRAALKLMEEAGWSVQDGVMKNADGESFAFDIVLRAGAAQSVNIATLYADALKRLGIRATLVTMDPPQYKERTQNYDFDMAYYRRYMSLSPGNEQKLYWGSAGVETPGTRNWMGMNSPAAEAMIDAMLNADSQDDYVAATRALDRVLTAGRYVVPIWYGRSSNLAHKKELHFPETTQMYGDWIGFMPDVWWYED